jgi:uncharacterized SAM-binding protein YcdF (DUF218 family)
VDALLVLGKELRRDPERARRELAARSAAAAVAWRCWRSPILALEGVLRGQEEPGCDIVRRELVALGVPADQITARPWTCSTREEVLRSVELLDQVKGRRMLAITAAYHVPRTRRYFRQIQRPVRVASPEAFLRGATQQERQQILAGTPDAHTLELERQTERKLDRMEALVGFLPDSVAWRLEVRSGRWFRSLRGQWSPGGDAP